MTGFNNITTSNHCGLYLDLQAEAIANPQNQSTTPSFERKLNSKSPQAIRTYEKSIKKKIEQNQYEKEVTRLMQIAGERQLTSQEEKELNQLDKQITQIMINSQRNVKGNNNTYPWSPKLHNAVKSVSIWKAKITQYKHTSLSSQPKRIYYQLNDDTN